MKRVRIFLTGLTEQQKQDLIALLRDAGYHVELVGEEPPEELIALVPEDLELQEDILIVLLDETCVNQKALQTEARRLAGGGGRLIGVWPKGVRKEKVPPTLEKYGADVVSWDPAKVAAAIEQKKEPQWETSEGAQRASRQG